MELVEIIDQRVLPLFCRHHLNGCKDYFFIFTGGCKPRGFLAWPGGDIRLQHIRSNKKMGRIRTKSLELTEDPIRCVVGAFGGSKVNWMQLEMFDDDYWTIYYDPTVDVRIMDKIVWTLSRLKIGGA